MDDDTINGNEYGVVLPGIVMWFWGSLPPWLAVVMLQSAVDGCGRCMIGDREEDTVATGDNKSIYMCKASL